MMNRAIKKILVSGISLLMLISVSIYVQDASANQFQEVKYLKEKPGSHGYEPVFNRGKGAVDDIGDKTHAQNLTKAQAEALNSGHSGSKSSSPAHYYHYTHHSSRPGLYLEPRHFQKPRHKAKEVTATKAAPSKQTQSLRIFHAGLIWTGIVLIGALLIYYFVNRHRRFRNKRYYY